MCRQRLALLAVVVCVLARVQAQTGDAWFKTRLELGQEVVLNCSDPEQKYKDNRYVPEDFVNYTITGWMRPDLTIIRNLNFNDGNISIEQNGTIYRIKKTYTQHFGPYFCLTRNDTGALYMLKLGINMRGPYFKNLWEQYRLNTIIGCSAGGGFLVLALLVLLVYKYRYQPTKYPETTTSASGTLELRHPHTVDVATSQYSPSFARNGSAPIGQVNQAFSDYDMPNDDAHVRARHVEHVTEDVTRF